MNATPPTVAASPQTAEIEPIVAASARAAEFEPTAPAPLVGAPSRFPTFVLSLTSFVAPAWTGRCAGWGGWSAIGITLLLYLLLCVIGGVGSRMVLAGMIGLRMQLGRAGG